MHSLVVPITLKGPYLFFFLLILACFIPLILSYFFPPTHQNPSIMAHLGSTYGNHSLSMLERLPIELLQLIARQLPLSSAASLSLCSKTIAHVVGLQYRHKLSSQTLEKQDFLVLIERDHPGYWLCHVCTRLHPRPGQTLEHNGPSSNIGSLRSLPRYNRKYDIFRNGCCNRSGLNAWYPALRPTLKITHPMVHLAMNRHFFGPSHGNPLDIFYTPFQRDVIGEVNISTQARIIADEFYLRWQYRIVIPFSGGFDQVWKLSLGLCICPHLQTTLVEKDIITRICECMLSHRNNGPCQNCNRSIKCRSCLTEFEVAIHKLESIGHILEITTWKNFGSGRSAKDQKWADQVWETARNKVYPFPGDPFETSQAIIRSAFESHQSSETTGQSQSSPPESSISVVDSNRAITDLPQILPGNFQPAVGSDDTVISPPKPFRKIYRHLVVSYAALAARKLKVYRKEMTKRLFRKDSRLRRRPRGGLSPGVIGS